MVRCNLSSGLYIHIKNKQLDTFEVKQNRVSINFFIKDTDVDSAHVFIRV